MTAVLSSSSIMLVQTPVAAATERFVASRTGVLTGDDRRGGVSRTHRAPSARATAALLPHPRLGAGRGGHGAGDAPGGLARPRRIRGPRVHAGVALPDCDPTL